MPCNHGGVQKGAAQSFLTPRIAAAVVQSSKLQCQPCMNVIISSRADSITPVSWRIVSKRGESHVNYVYLLYYFPSGAGGQVQRLRN
jgi:hypothetical protein